ncbi:hypothetical protein MPNT_80007 [Candidatus Methylacidithermus pantelleriae]|uniref:Uncharacterized protein n=1 Tax=Candidatus Methylacidithermus pantelleriae TaxID=2744239 RepID=A0A8J2BQX7_9BACT|nr:hypothetical protein MPNT_80007 [Candidatus Methylacidithermus pantelleriae]
MMAQVGFCSCRSRGDRSRPGRHVCDRCDQSRASSWHPLLPGGRPRALAPRGLGLSKRPWVWEAVAPTCDAGHVTFALPASNRTKHLCSIWPALGNRLKAVHAAHLRLKANGFLPGLCRRERGNGPLPELCL